MAPGLASALAANCKLSGVVTADAAVLEVDERSSPYIYKYFAPDYLLCTNLFRDSIKRNGHSEFIFDKIASCLPESTKLLLNGNDAISGMLGENHNERIFYSVDRTVRSTETCPNTVCDLTACPKCHHPLEYSYFHYHHIGVPHCPTCGFAMPESTYTASDVDFEHSMFTFHDPSGESIRLPFTAGNLFNVFNVTSAAAICRLAGVSCEVIENSVADLTAKTGRFEAAHAGPIDIVTMLFKNQNPISGSQSLGYLDNIPGHKDVVLVVTDSKDKVHGHEDISWLYDTDFASLLSPDVGKIFLGGTRCKDLALRLILAGIPESKLVLYPEYETLYQEITAQVRGTGTVAIYFELYAMPIATRLRQILTNHFAPKA